MPGVDAEHSLLAERRRSRIRGIFRKTVDPISSAASSRRNAISSPSRREEALVGILHREGAPDRRQVQGGYP